MPVAGMISITMTVFPRKCHDEVNDGAHYSNHENKPLKENFEKKNREHGAIRLDRQK